MKPTESAFEMLDFHCLTEFFDAKSQSPAREWLTQPSPLVLGSFRWAFDQNARQTPPFRAGKESAQRH